MASTISDDLGINQTVSVFRFLDPLGNRKYNRLLGGNKYSQTKKPPQPSLPAKKVSPSNTMCAPYLSSTWPHATPSNLKVNASQTNHPRLFSLYHPSHDCIPPHCAGFPKGAPYPYMLLSALVTLDFHRNMSSLAFHPHLLHFFFLSHLILLEASSIVGGLIIVGTSLFKLKL